jgi:hypothetical protein
MEYAKIILPKVCFWESLFKKELLKCISWTNKNELNELCGWCYNNFSEKQLDILDDAFTGIASNTKISAKSVKPNKIQIKYNRKFEAA